MESAFGLGEGERMARRSEKQLKTLLQKYGIRTSLTQERKVIFPLEIGSLINILQKFKDSFPGSESLINFEPVYRGNSLTFLITHPLTEEEKWEKVKEAEKKEKEKKNQEAEKLRSQMETLEKKFGGRRPF